MKKRHYYKILFSISVILSAVTILCACTKTQEPITKRGFYFNTIITVTLYDTQDETLLSDCFALADKYEKLFSTTIETSDVFRINHSNGQPVAVDSETITLLEKGLSYSHLSNGLFDLTIGKLSSLWNFSENEGNVPAGEAIADAVSTINYQNILINDNQVTLADSSASIDLGGIAKGYIADRMKVYLVEHGVTSATINLGGNVLVIGDKPDNSAFTIGIQKPFDPEGTPIATVKIKDQTVVSSGIYERCFTVDDTLYHHILDTTTGYPYNNDLLGVSIICNDSVDGDALSTTCFALGLEKGMELVESLEDTEAIFITSDYELHTSSGIGTDIPFEKRKP